MCGTDGKKVGGELNAIGLMNTVVSLPSSSSCSSYANASRDGERGGGALRQEMGDGRRGGALFRSRRILFTLLVCLLCSPVVAAGGVYKRGRRRKGEECWRRRAGGRERSEERRKEPSSSYTRASIFPAPRQSNSIFELRPPLILFSGKARGGGARLSDGLPFPPSLTGAATSNSFHS